MLNLIKYEGKTEEQAIEKYMNESNQKRDEFIYKVEHIEGKLFKGEKYIVSILPKNELINYITEYFENLGKLMRIKISTEVTIEENNFNINISSNNNSTLIGKEGKTLNALQIIIRQNLYNQIGLHAKINLDISNYRLNKLKSLNHQLEHIIKEVIETKMEIYLDPMNSYERRYVHNLVNGYNYVKTESTGVEPNRRIVIKYDENKKI